MLYSNEILNLGDCKRVGVYHEKKVASTYPVKLSFSIERGHYQFSYSFPELPKKIFTYHSEAGTSARKHAVEHHSRSEKKTIKTIPTQFVVSIPNHPPICLILLLQGHNYRQGIVSGLRH